MTRAFENIPSPPRDSKPRRFRRSGLNLFWTLCFVVACAATGLADDKAALIFVNGPIVTVDPAQPEAEALAVNDDGLIMAVGDLQSLSDMGDESTKCINLRGRTLMPGFIEPHTHVITTAYFQHLMKDLSSFEVPTNPGTIAQMQAALKKELAENPLYRTEEGKWLLAFGVDPSRATPFMASLDAESLDQVQLGVEIDLQVPIFVVNQSEHIAYVNTKAMRLAKINGHTRNPAGGVYVRKNEACDPNGINDCPLTGELHEAGAFKAFQVVIGRSKANQPDSTHWRKALEKTYDSFAKAGVTTATELALGATLGVDQEFELLTDMIGQQLRIRAYVYATAPGASVSTKALMKYENRDLLDIAGVKFVVDGSTQGLTAFLKKPYDYQQARETGNKGVSNYTGDRQLYDAAEPYALAGWQLSMHGNGDAALDQVLDVYQELSKLPQIRKDRRWRIEHLTVTDETQITRIRQLGLTASMTIGHVYFWGQAFGTARETAPAHKAILGSDRAQRIDPAKSLLGSKESDRVRFSFNSDSPVSPVAPLRYISTAVTRREQGGTVLGDKQRITVDQAIRAVTLDAAYQLLLDKQVGSLEVGKFADLVVLAQNPRAPGTKAEEIMNIPVLATFVEGVQKSGSYLPPCLWQEFRHH